VLDGGAQQIRLGVEVREDGACETPARFATSTVVSLA